MKFIKKIPPENEVKTKELRSEGWHPLKEPRSTGVAIFYAIPISLILMFLNFIWFYFFFPPVRNFIEGENGLAISFNINLATLVYAFFILAFLFIHELIHALFIPNILHSKNTFMGFNGMFGFVYTEEVLSKGRFLVISIMPLLLLSFVFPTILLSMGMMTGYIMFLSILNAGGSCVDVLNMLLVAKQVPPGGLIVSNGPPNFYKG